MFASYLLAVFLCAAIAVVGGTLKHSAESNVGLETSEIIDNKTDTKTKPPSGLYLKAYTLAHGSKAFENYTFEKTIELIDSVDEWDSPDLSQRFPYYLSGYDYEDRPIWVAEVGKYDVKAVVERGQGGMDDLDKYALKGILRVLKSLILNDTDSQQVRDIAILADWEGLDISQITHLPTVAFALELARKYLDIGTQLFGYAIAINVNYVAEKGLDLIRPILGGLFERIEIYGSNKAKWVPALRRKLPENAIPTWYGGSQDFKPLKAYG